MAGKLIDISEVGIVFLSYDEANAETNWARLLQVAPWAKRSHGIQGFDAAHKVAAKLVSSEYVLTVDGDNWVFPEFFDLALELPEALTSKVLSWNSRNVVNGLCYGNGGLKLWPRDYLMDMKTHEASERPETATDFCWGGDYVQMHNLYSETRPNGSVHQAWRSGFREGVKMTFVDGKPSDPEQFLVAVHEQTRRRLYQWCTLGAHAVNGSACVFGAIEGMWNALCNESFDHTIIRDYDKLSQRYHYGAASSDEYEVFDQHCEDCGVRRETNESAEEAMAIEIEEVCDVRLRFVTDPLVSQSIVENYLPVHRNSRDPLKLEGGDV